MYARGTLVTLNYLHRPTPETARACRDRFSRSKVPDSCVLSALDVGSNLAANSDQPCNCISSTILPTHRLLVSVTPTALRSKKEPKIQIMTTQSIKMLEASSDSVDIIRDMVASENQEDSFYILHIGDLVASFCKWKEVLPDVVPYYAVKCNPHELVLKTLAALGAGFDCASKNEIEQVMALGVDPQRIIFAHPTKMIAHIQHSARVGVELMTFDSEYELLKIKTHMSHAKVIIRIRSDAVVAQISMGKKFGCNPASEARRLLKSAADMGITVVGVSFHVGSGAHEFEAYERAVKLTRRVFDMGVSLGHSGMYLVDIGGGFLEYTSESIDKVAIVIKDAITKHFSGKDIKVIAEPGRYFVDSAFTLAVQIYSKREILEEDSEEKEAQTMYFINDGVYGSFCKTVFDQQKVTFEPIKKCSADVSKCSVWGPTCSVVDCISPGALLPSLSVGDWLTVRNMGAYTLCISSTFNGFPLPRVRPVIDRVTWSLLRKVWSNTESWVENGELHFNTSNL